MERTRKTKLVEVAELADRLETLRQQTGAFEQVFRAFIRDAITEGLPVADIAQAARISRERVYQIRDGRR